MNKGKHLCLLFLRYTIHPHCRRQKAAERVYRVSEAEQAKVLAFIQSLDIKAIATEVMYKLFTMLEMKYDFKLSKNNEMEETR